MEKPINKLISLGGVRRKRLSDGREDIHRNGVVGSGTSTGVGDPCF
jgi:hypothetical protein